MTQLALAAKPSIHSRIQPKTIDHIFYIYNEIEGPDSVVEIVEALDLAQEGDTIHIHIASPGGDLEGSIVLIHAMLRTKAHVVCHADGEVESAATLLFFAGREYVVNPFAHFMFHDASFGVAQKVNEQRKRLESVTNLLQSICTFLYYPAFTYDEIDEILEGRDVYVTADEMVERINEGLQRAEDEENEEEAEYQQELLTECGEEVVPH